MLIMYKNSLTFLYIQYYPKKKKCPADNAEHLCKILIKSIILQNQKDYNAYMLTDFSRYFQE